MNSDIKRAIIAEKAFNNKNNLLVTFQNYELSENLLKSLHRSVRSVHFLEPEYKAQHRCIVELKDSSKTDLVRDSLMRSFNKKGHLTINSMDYSIENNKNIDPCKLLVKNLPNFISDRNIKLLYPLYSEFDYVESHSSNKKSVVVSFANAKDALNAYKTTNQLLYQSNILKVQFYRNCNKSEEHNEDENTDSEDDTTKWEKIENNHLKNKKVSDTLLVTNFPLDATGIEILKLFPDCCDYKFLSDSSSKSKSALIRFRRVEDAIKTYTISNNIFKANILQIEFYYKTSDLKKKKKISIEDNKCTNGRKVFKQEDRSQNHSDLNNFENLNEEEMISENVNPCVLHVENLPLRLKNEDFLELFPNHQTYELIPKESASSCSAYITFSNSSKALKAFKFIKSKMYKGRILSVEFKSKKMKINPFAVLKRKSSFAENSFKKFKTNLNVGVGHDDGILVDEKQKIPQELICEDDIDCETEDEDYADDVYDNLHMDEEFLDNDDNLSEDNDSQDIELGDDTVLPLDEDDF